MKVIITAGGTGGHIYPALAILNKIKEKEPNSTFLYIGTKDRMEKDIVPKQGIPYLGIDMQGLNRKHIFKNIKVLLKTYKNIKFLKKKIKEFNPDIVIGVAGYVTLPVIYASYKLGYKTFIHEQNLIPGMTNKFLAKKVDKIGVSLKGSLKYFPKDKTIYTGNPRSEEVKNSKYVSLDKLDSSLDPNKKLVIIVMGSLGSKTMNIKLKETLPLFKNKDYQVIFVTGKNYYEYYKEIKVSNNVKIVPYLNNMMDYLKNTSCIVSRSGASTISEITVLGIPPILIPSPYVTNNHQYLNAKELFDNNACILMEEMNFNSKELVNNIDKIINDNKFSNELKNNLLKLGVSDSATKIYNIIKEITE